MKPTLPLLSALPAFVAPRLRSNEADRGQRHATWLELFYDLVYVIVVGALGHELYVHLDIEGVLRTAALFVPIWWSWIGVTLYNDRFDTDDTGQRVITLLQMLGAAALALGVHTAFEGPTFALSYAFLRVLLIVQYLRVGRHVPLARPLALRYGLGFSIAAALWVVSLLLPTPWRFLLWGIAMVIDIGTPLTARASQAKLPLSASHLPERIGLFTIVVLGEAVAAILGGVEQITLEVALLGTLGLSLAFAIWWIYFDNMEEHLVRKTRVSGLIWFYVHLPLLMGIAGTAVAVEHLVQQDPFQPLPPAPRWLLACSLALALVALAAIHLTTAARLGPRRHPWRASVRFVSAGIVLALAAIGTVLPAAAFAFALALVAAAQIRLEPERKVAVQAS